MRLFKKHPSPRIRLHALEPRETWFERCYWLVLLVNELKAERDQLRKHNQALLRQVNSGMPLSVPQEEFLAMREELNELYKAKAKLDNRVSRTFQVHQSLMDEIEDLREGRDRAA